MKSNRHLSLRWTSIFSLALLSFLSFATGPSAHADLVITTTPSSGFLWGEPNAASIGQTFRTDATNPILKEFSIFVDDIDADPDVLDFGMYITEWNELSNFAVGPVLYESGITSSTNNGGAGGIEQFTFAPNLTLNPGTQYVAIFSSSEFFDGSTGRGSAGLTSTSSDQYTDGQGFFASNGNDFNQLFNSGWTFTGSDLHFSATFTTAVPDASSLTLLGAAGAIAYRRRRRKKN